MAKALKSTSAPFAVAGVAAVAVAAVGGVLAPGAEATNNEAGAALLPNQRTPHLDEKLSSLRTTGADVSQRASRAQREATVKEKERLEQERAEAEERRQEAERPKVVLPLTSDYHITARFGSAGRMWSRRHTGLDMATSSGSSVRAVADGTIVSATWAGSYGWRVIVRHTDGTESWYCHLSHFEQRSGKVKAGDVIAASGNTGNSSGPHLHLEIRPDGGGPVDPYDWLADHGVRP